MNTGNVQPEGETAGESLVMGRSFPGAVVGPVFCVGGSRRAGAAGGRTGAYPLTSRPAISTLYRMVTGGLIATGFHSTKTNR